MSFEFHNVEDPGDDYDFGPDDYFVDDYGFERTCRTEVALELGRSVIPSSRARSISRMVLGTFLLFTGIGHLTFGRAEFTAQVPDWLPVDADIVVVGSGVVEVVLGAALIALPGYRVAVGWLVAAFFVAIFPGNISQYQNRVDAFGLNTDGARAVRLLFQPVLVLWALWSTGAWRDRAALRSLARRRP